MTLLKNYLILVLAIACEVLATTSLTRSDGFTRLMPSLGAVLGYCVAFWLLSFPLRTMPAGIVYAIWSGVGMVLIALVGWVWLKQTLDTPAILGLGLILSGVIVINLFSRSIGH